MLVPLLILGRVFRSLLEVPTRSRVTSILTRDVVAEMTSYLLRHRN